VNKEKSEQEEKVGLLEFFQIIFWIVETFWKITPLYLFLNIITSVIKQAYSLINAFILGLIIDLIIRSVQQSDIDTNAYLLITLILLGVRFSNTVVSWIQNYSVNLIRLKSENLLNRNLYIHIQQLGVQTVEDPSVANVLSRAERNIYNMYDLLDRSIRLFSYGVMFILSTLTVLTFLPIMIPILIAVSIPKVLFETHYLKKDWSFHLDNTEAFRKNNRDSSFLTNKNSIPELLLTNGNKFLDRKFLNFNTWMVKSKVKIYQPWYFIGGMIEFIFEIFILFGFYNIILNFAKGLISVGDITFQFRSLDILQSNIIDFAMQYTGSRQAAVRLKEVKEVLSMKSQVKDGEIVIPKMQNPPSISLVNLEFAYPNSETKVIKSLNLEIQAGEKVAIVGRNGAGKTTLVKLISKFYQPTSGEILINNNQNLQDYKSESWYQNLGVLMQDYNKYEHMTVKENVIMGDPDRPVDDEHIKGAIEFADAKDFVEAYPNKYDQILSENFQGGTRPSGGQWQKIALARFFYRNAPLLIFDEPTSAIDAESEYKIFNKIYEFFENKTVIIISHRFSTVRNADRIIVLDDGQVLEQGSHDELIKLNGKYAEMFRLQALGYGEKV
jgi:ATP-binding cassette subfamily B protein